MEKIGKKTLTIFTPTFNRAYILSQLYQSLLVQTCKDFEWVIIDDGSSDNTRELVNRFQTENKISIRYIFCKNGGKQRAINKGVQTAKGELFFIVDSDDELTEGAVEKVLSAWEDVVGKEFYAGLCFKRLEKNTLRPLGGEFPEAVFDSDSLELAFRYRKNIDKAEIFRTEILKHFLFPEIEGENFVPEALVWYRIAAAGFKLRCIDEGIYICEYLADGLTRNFRANLKNNPGGFVLFYRELLRYPQPLFFPDKLKAVLRFLQCKIYFKR